MIGKNRSRQSNVSKTRVLQDDLGRDNDTLYFASSGSFYPGTKTQDEWHAILTSWYNAGRSNRGTDVTLSRHLGAESINTSRGRYKVMNNCTHIKQRYVCYPVTRSAEGWLYPSEHNYEKYWRYPATMPYWSDAANTALDAAREPSQQFSARAYWSMRPKFQSDVSLINNIFELKDYSDVASLMFGKNKSANTKIRRMLKTAKKLNRVFNRTPVQFGINLAAKSGDAILNALSRPSATVATLTGLMAKGQLTYALEIMPTIRDIITIHATAQKDVSELARNFQKYGEEGSRSHFSESETILTSITPGEYNRYCWGSGSHIKRTFSATMVSYYRTLWEKLETRYPHWWGLEVGVDEVWNMLPLSFVLDYVMTIGKSLEYMDKDDSVDILSTEYCESCKVIAQSGYFYLQDTRTPALMIDGFFMKPKSEQTPRLVTGTAGSYYQRVVKEPYKGPALPKIKVPSSRQLANLLALARCILF